MSKQWSTEDFWKYSIEIYSKEKVQRCCLALQNEAQLNINLLLLCGWLNQENTFLATEQIRALIVSICQQDKRIQSHRKIRIEAKQGNLDKYAELLEQELELERQQQGLLIDRLNIMSNFCGTKSNFQIYLGCVDWKTTSVKATAENYMAKLQTLLNYSKKCDER